MIDHVVITARGGHGGAGGISFVKRPGLSKPPPDGGNGGNGGDLYLEATTSRNNLLDFRFKKNFQAHDGEPGYINNRNGAGGEDAVLSVPLGTEVYWLDRIIADLTQDGQKVLVARGGRGGRGNMHMRTKEDRRPHHSEPGEQGEYKELRLELKVLAEVGLIGLPNAGKSTLLSKLTAAHPKVGAYPFTTLDPNLGVLNWKGQNIVIADIPGLIEGAAEGKGIGHDFLRHIERTKLLVHLTDSLASYQLIRDELEKYNPALLKKKEIVAVSRIDTLTPDERKKVLADLKKKRLKPITLSAVTGEGLEDLKNLIIENLSK